MASIPSPHFEDKASVAGFGIERADSFSRADSVTGNANEAQKAAIRFDHDENGPVLVLAGAGSGKTTVLAGRLAYLLDRGVPSESIIALTFTRDAATEMRERVERKCRELGIEGSAPIITTFHALAFGIIGRCDDREENWRRLGFSRKPSLMEETERAALIKSLRASEGSWVTAESLDDCLYVSGKDDLRTERLREKYLAFVRAECTLAFGDMVPLALTLARENPGWLRWWRERHTHFLVDEFQDTSPDQLELMRQLVGNRANLFMVGDDDQAIYSFRGADSRCLDSVFDFYPDLKVIKLEENYRSTPSIVAYANRIFANKPKALRKILRPCRMGAGSLFRRNRRPSLMVHASVESQAEWMLGEMRRLQEEHGLAWSDFAVLYRINALEEAYRDNLRSLAGEETGAIRFMTVHGSKGLQFPVVFFVGLEQGICPYREALGSSDPEKLREERRVFYVGVTRAESRLYLCCCLERKMHGKKRRYRPSMFLRSRFFLGLKSLGAVLFEGPAAKAS